MAKILLSYTLIGLVLFQCSMKLAVIAWYQVNKEYIAATLCENKAVPQMQCNGKCYLSKQMKASEEQERKLPSFMKVLLEVFHLPASYSIAPNTLALLPESAVQAPYVMHVYTSPLDRIFQPPQ